MVVTLVPFVFAVAGLALTSVIAQLMQAYIEIAQEFAEKMTIVILTPFLLMGTILRGGLDGPVFTIDVEYHGTILDIPCQPDL